MEKQYPLPSDKQLVDEAVDQIAEITKAISKLSPEQREEIASTPLPTVAKEEK